MLRSINVKRGFTLVELLVVISIIALLLAVLMPSLNKAREGGRKIVCGTNEKQITMAFLMYAEENNGMIVQDRGIRRTGQLAGSDRGRSWDSSLASIWGTKKNDALKKYVACPSDFKKRLKDTTGTYNAYQGTGDALKRSYAPNIAMYNNVGATMYPGNNSWDQPWDLHGDDSMTPTRVAQIKHPSRTILVGEYHIGAGEIPGTAPCCVYGNVQGTQHWGALGKPLVHTAVDNSKKPICTQSQTQLHPTGGNWSFCDGSVRWHGLNPGANWTTGQPYKDLNFPLNWQWNK